jgi:hypothetical protein
MADNTIIIRIIADIASFREALKESGRLVEDLAQSSAHLPNITGDHDVFAPMEEAARRAEAAMRESYGDLAGLGARAGEIYGAATLGSETWIQILQDAFRAGETAQARIAIAEETLREQESVTGAREEQQRSGGQYQAELNAIADPSTAMQGIDSVLAPMSSSLQEFFRSTVQGTRTVSQAFKEMLRSLALEFATSGIKAGLMGGGKSSPWSAIFGTHGEDGGLEGVLLKALKGGWATTLGQMAAEARSWLSKVTSIFSGLTPAFGAIVNGMSSMWRAFTSAASLAAGILSSILRSNALKQASAAAVGTFSQVMQTVPPPASFILAPAAAAAAFGGTISLAAFEVGGLVPRDMLALVHRGEVVVPTSFADLLRSGQIGFGGGEVHLHYAPVFHVAGGRETARTLGADVENVFDMVRGGIRAGRHLRSRY